MRYYCRSPQALPPAHAPLRHYACLMQARALAITAVAQRLSSTQSTGSSTPALACTVPHCHYACLRQARANAITGSPQRLSCNEALVSPLRGSSGRPYGAMLFLFPPSTRVVPSVPPVGRLLVSPLPPSPSLRYPALSVPLALLAPPPLRSLTLVAAGIPPRVAGRSPPRLTLAYASGIPPALQKVSIVPLSCVRLLFLMRHSLSHCALRQLASQLPPDGVTASR